MSISPDLATKRYCRTSGAAGTYDECSEEPKVSVRFPLPMFTAINRLAKQKRSSFARIVRELIAHSLNDPHFSRD